MEIAINFDESGFKFENVFDIICFVLNKEGTCKNKTGVIGFSLPESDFGIYYQSILPIGANDEKSKCITLTIDESKLPFYCKEIIVFAYTRNPCSLNAKFSDLEFFNVFHNNEKIYSLEKNDKKSTTGVFQLCNIVRMPNEFILSPSFEFINKDIIELGKSFNIDFIEEDESKKTSSNKGSY